MTALPPQPTWTPERIEQLKAYFEDGLSCRDIAISLGVSRNAVIGKLSRLNLTRTTPEERRARKKRAARLVPASASGDKIVVLQEACAPSVEHDEIAGNNTCSLFELSEQRCRWPISTPGEDFRFCGNATLGSAPYCSGHVRLAYQANPRQRSARN